MPNETPQDLQYDITGEIVAAHPVELPANVLPSKDDSDPSSASRFVGSDYSDSNPVLSGQSQSPQAAQLLPIGTHVEGVTKSPGEHAMNANADAFGIDIRRDAKSTQ